MVLLSGVSIVLRREDHSLRLGERRSDDNMQPFTARVLKIIQLIPEGKIMTYGQIAAEAGSPRGARQVVRILHTLSSKHRLPWHRVVNRLGEIALQDDEGASLQRLLLEAEGIQFMENGRISLEKYLHDSQAMIEDE
ncbi:methylated-DNA-protein-cysteine methyltransferase-like protein [Paenibacillus sp. RC254]